MPERADAQKQTSPPEHRVARCASSGPVNAAAKNGGPCSAEAGQSPALFRSRLHPSTFGMVGADFRPQADSGSMLSPRYPRHKHSGQTWRSFRDTGRSGPEVRMWLEATSHMRTPSRPLVASRGCCLRRLETQNPTLAGLDQRADVVFPERQRVADLTLIGALVVDAGDAAPVPGLMVENLLDHMRQNAEIVQPSRDRPAKIVHHPSRDARALVERALGGVPRPEAVHTHAEQIIAAHHPRHALDDVEHHRQERPCMRATVLAARRGQPPAAILKGIKLRPAHAADLLSSGTKQNEELDNAAVVAVTAGKPDSPKFIVGQHAVAWLAGVRLDGTDHRIALSDTHLHCPPEESVKRRASAGRNDGAALAFDVDQPIGHILPRHDIDRHPVQRLERRAGQVAPQFNERARPRLLGRQISVDLAEQAVSTLGAALLALGLRVATKRDLGQGLLRGGPCHLGPEHLGAAESDPAGLVAALVLYHP